MLTRASGKSGHVGHACWHSNMGLIQGCGESLADTEMSPDVRGCDGLMRGSCGISQDPFN